MKMKYHIEFARKAPGGYGGEWGQHRFFTRKEAFAFLRRAEQRIPGITRLIVQHNVF